MKLELHPVKIECYDVHIKQLVFTVESFDDLAATVDIKDVLNADSWGEISAAVREALVMLRLEDDMAVER